MSRHPLLGHAVRVSPGGPPRAFVRSFDGIVMDLLPEGILLVMRLDDGTVKTWGAEYVTFADPERAARALRLHATDNDFRAAGCTVLPEYTPPRWVPAKDVAFGSPVLAVAYPNDFVSARNRDDEDWGQEDVDALAAEGFAAAALVLVGKWPPLPKEGA